MMKPRVHTVLTVLATLALTVSLCDDSFAQRKRTQQGTRIPAPPKQSLPVQDTSAIATAVPTPQVPAFKDTLHLTDTLKALRQRAERMQTVLDKVTFGPQSFYFSRLRSWTIPLSDMLNDSISQYFFEVSDNDSSFIESRGDIQVIATPEPSHDLVAMYFAGNNKERKGQRLREALMKKPDRQMYRQILESREFSEDKELIDRKFKIADLSAPRLVKDVDSVLVSFDRYSLSIDHDNETVVTIRVPDNLRIRFGHMWGAEVKLGYDEFGFPFWTSGNIDFLAIYNQIKVGLHIPFKWGVEEEGLIALWKPRILTGTYGVTTDFDWAFAGGSVVVGFPRNDPSGTFYSPPDSLFYIKAAAQAWYSFTLNIHENTNLFRFKTGLGMEVIGIDRFIRRTEEFEKIESRFFWSPYFKVDYLNQQFARRFGLSLQYFRARAFSNLWLEVIPGHLRIELKFATTVIRAHETWEPAYFYTIAIPYTFSL